MHTGTKGAKHALWLERTKQAYWPRALNTYTNVPKDVVAVYKDWRGSTTLMKSSRIAYIDLERCSLENTALTEAVYCHYQMWYALVCTDIIKCGMTYFVLTLSNLVCPSLYWRYQMWYAPVCTDFIQCGMPQYPVLSVKRQSSEDPIYSLCGDQEWKLHLNNRELWSDYSK